MRKKAAAKTAKILGSGLIIGAVLVGCGGGGGGTGSDAENTTTSTSITGDAIKGPMSKAKISLYKTSASGAQGDLLTETTSDDNGHYEAKVIGYSGIVLVVVSVVPGQTKMYDEATGVQVEPASDFSMRAAIAAEAGKSYNAQVNPFTELATVQALARSGGLSANNVAQSHKDLKETLGFDPTEAPQFDASTKTPKNSLGAALKALSEMARAGESGCASGSQASRVKCVTDDLAKKGLTNASMKSALQARLDVELDKAALPSVKLSEPSGTPVTPESSLAKVKAFFAALRSNAKALEAADMSLKTELEAVANDMQNRTAPMVSKNIDALDLAAKGAQYWRDVMVTGSATYASRTAVYSWAFVPGGVAIPDFGPPLGYCTFFEDDQFSIEALTKSDAKYFGCATAPEYVPTLDVNGFAQSCLNVGEQCSSAWTIRIRLFPDAANAGKFQVYTQTRKAKIVRTASGTAEDPDKATRVHFGAAFPGNASTLTGQWDGAGKLAGVTLVGELSPGFEVDYWTRNVTVIGDKHNVNLSAVMSTVGALDKLAFSGSIDVIKAGALETAISIEAGSYLQASNGNYQAHDGQQEMLLKLKASTAGSAVTGDIKLSGMKADKSNTRYLPTTLAFAGSVQRGGRRFFEGSMTADVLDFANYSVNLPNGAANPSKLRIGLTGKVSIPNRPTLNVGLSTTIRDEGGSNFTTATTGQYSQGSLSINLTANSALAGDTLTMTSSEGVKMVVKSGDKTYPLTFGAGNDSVGSFDPKTNRITYTDNSYEQF